MHTQTHATARAPTLQEDQPQRLTRHPPQVHRAAQRQPRQHGREKNSAKQPHVAEKQRHVSLIVVGQGAAQDDGVCSIQSGRPEAKQIACGAAAALGGGGGGGRGDGRESGGVFVGGALPAGELV
jgi:hypothetical protein